MKLRSLLLLMPIHIGIYSPKVEANANSNSCRKTLLRIAKNTALLSTALLLTQDTEDPDSTDNWAEVYPNSKVYRSRMLGPTRLEERLRYHGIKTLLVLDELPQYESELAQKYGIAVVHLPMPRDPYPANNFLDTIRKSFQVHERPIMLHCRHGADRTGLVCALYLYEEEGLSKEEAKSKGLCLRHGHCGAITHPKIHEFWKNYNKGDWYPKAPSP